MNIKQRVSKYLKRQQERDSCKSGLLKLQQHYKMTTTSNNMSNQGIAQSSTSSMAQFASIQIHDALIKFSLYLQKLTSLQQSPTYQTQQKCHKLVRLILQCFNKYAETEQFSRQSYQLVKSFIIMKKSYYSLLVMDLMMKNNKYIIKQVKKELEPMMKFIWEKVSTQIDKEIKQSRLENLKVIIKCWGFIFGDKLQETIRKWLQVKYAIKRIQVTEDNQKLLKETYGDKLKDSAKLMNSQRETKLSQALLNSLIDDDNPVVNNNNTNSVYLSNSNIGSSGGYGPNVYPQSRQSIQSDPRMYRHQTSFSQIPMNTTKDQQTKSNDSIRPPYTNNLPNNSNGNPQQPTTKPKSLQGMNKSLLEALDLS